MVFDRSRRAKTAINTRAFLGPEKPYFGSRLEAFLMHMPEEEKLEYENLEVLTHKYADPKNPNQCNYIRFTNDLACCAKSLDTKSVIQMPMIEGYSNKEDKVYFLTRLSV